MGAFFVRDQQRSAQFFDFLIFMPARARFPRCLAVVWAWHLTRGVEVVTVSVTVSRLVVHGDRPLIVSPSPARRQAARARAAAPISLVICWPVGFASVW